MSFVLRPYQEQAVQKGLDFLRTKTGRGGLIVMPTGAGKSLVIAEIVRHLDGPCLVFQPSKEILEQNRDKLVSYGYTPAIYSASLNRKEVGAITLATIGSVARKAELFADTQYVIADECHLINSKAGLYQEFLAAGNATLLGLTATPYRLTTDGYGGSILKFLTRTRPRVFTDVVDVIQNGDLFRDGYLAKIEYQTIKGFDDSRLQTNSTGADFTDASVQREVNLFDG